MKGKMETRKLDKTDLEQLTTLQESYQQVTQQIANCTIDESMLTERLQEIQQEKQAYMQQFKDLRSKEEQLIEQLKEKYGEGQINIQDGTFTAS
jgi:predicted transcriptional regulator